MTADPSASSPSSQAPSAATRDAPAFDFYPERWLVGTAAMSDLEQIAYLRLLCHQWLGGDAGLTADPATLRRLAGKGCTAAVLAKFAGGADGRLRNARLEIIRQEQRDRIRKKSEQRRAAAQKRWHGAGGPDREEEEHREISGHDAAAMRPHESRNAGEAAEEMRSFCGGNAHHSPPTTHPDEKRASLARAPAGGWPSLREVTAYAADRLMTPAACAERFWNDCEASGWVNRHGQLIRDWRPMLCNFASQWKANEAREKALKEAARGGAGGRPRYVAYNAKTATAGLTPEEISVFCRDQR